MRAEAALSRGLVTLNGLEATPSRLTLLALPGASKTGTFAPSVGVEAVELLRCLRCCCCELLLRIGEKSTTRGRLFPGCAVID